MKRNYLSNLLVLFLCGLTHLNLSAQNSTPELIGYWHNWNTTDAPYIPLDAVDSRYTIIDVAFAVPTSPSDMHMNFTPDIVTQSTFTNQIQTIQNQ